MPITADYHSLPTGLGAAPARRGVKRLLRGLRASTTILRGDVLHNTLGAYHVLRLWHVQKVGAGLIDRAHPWCTGQLPDAADSAWLRNVVFRTAPRPDAEPDEHIMQKVGAFLAEMVKKSAQLPELPHGPERRMPHVVNYLHGSVHCNGLWLLFNDFAEAKHYFADPRFRREFVRVVRRERREVTLVFRERRYDPIEYAYFSGFMMSCFPWFANVNGPGKKVMWGNPAPYPAMNIITGNWVRDVDNLRRGHPERIVKPALQAADYFRGEYGAPAPAYTLPERLIAYLENEWVRRRGFNAGLFFIDRKKIDPRIYEKYQDDKATLAARQSVVPNPLRKPADDAE
jgi:hypothetical protein